MTEDSGPPEFIVRGAVADFIEDETSQEICISGAAGTGKTMGVMAFVHMLALDAAHPGVKILIVRKTHVSLTASTLVTFRTKIAHRALENGDVVWYGGSASEPPAFKYLSTGSVICVGGMDRSSRVLSTEWDLVIVDEATELTPEDLDVLVTRLRNGRLRRQQLVALCNPDAPTHPLKLRCDAGRMKLYFSQHEDNPAMYDAATGEWTEYGARYLAKLETLVGPRYERLRWGKWVTAEGTIYSEFNEAVHVVEPFEVTKTSGHRVVVSIDFGFSHAMVCQWWAVDHDGRMTLFREIHQTQLLVEDLARQIKQVYADNPEEPLPEAWVTDHAAGDRATLEKHLNIASTPAIKAVSRGIQAIQSRLRPAGDGRVRFSVMRGCLVRMDTALREAGKATCLVDEMFSYVWATDRKGDATDAPLKIDDDSVDCARYAAAYLDLQGTGRLGAPTSKQGGVVPTGKVTGASRYAREISRQTLARAPKRYGG